MRDIDNEFRSLLAEVIKRSHEMSGKDRKQIAHELSERLGRLATNQEGKPSRRPVTESMLNDFTRNIIPGRESHLPAAWLSALCEVLENDRLARLAMGPRLRELVEQGERLESMDSILTQMQATIAKLKGPGRGKKSQRKKTPKA